MMPLTPLLTPLRPQQMTAVYPISERLERQFPRRITMPSDAHSIWQIQTGLVRTLSWDADGSVTTLGIWGPGDVVGRPLSQVDPYEICCISAVKATLLTSRTEWSLDALLEYVRQTEALLQIARIQQTEGRLLQLLMWLAERFGYLTEKGIVTEIQMTHREIAETIGSSRVTVTRLLRVLEEKGKILRSRKRYLLLNEATTDWPD